MNRFLNASLLVSALAAAASADIAFNNLGPGDTYSSGGYIAYGPSVSPVWTHGFRFVAAAGGPITLLVAPIQHLEGDQNEFTFEIYGDAGGVPGSALGLVGTTPGFIHNTGPYPPPVVVAPQGQVEIASGTSYWLVVRGVGDAQGTLHQNDQGQMDLRAYSINGGPWNTGEVNTAAFRIEVAGGPGCYANCDDSTAEPVLNVADFTCFLQRFGAGDSYANCDGSTADPVLNVADFTCFLQQFGAGCP